MLVALFASPMVGFPSPSPLELPGLSFSPGLKIQIDVWNQLQRPISWPDLGSSSFALVVAFSRCKYKLSTHSVGLIIQPPLEDMLPISEFLSSAIACLSSWSF